MVRRLALVLWAELLLAALLLAALLLAAPSHGGQSLKVAVAANFKPLLKQLAADFEHQSGAGLRLSSASTGVLYAQIIHGAPFDVFLAADKKRPQLLQQQGLIIHNSRQTYALGQLVLWQPNAAQTPNQQLLLHWQDKLVIANPKTAPYGAAAQDLLQRLKLWPLPVGQLITAHSVAQAHQFVSSGSVGLGLMAHAQMKAHLKAGPGEVKPYWLVPPKWHQPIEQQLVILKRSGQPKLARDFIHWLSSAKIRQQIIDAGYSLPVPSS